MAGELHEKWKVVTGSACRPLPAALNPAAAAASAVRPSPPTAPAATQLQSPQAANSVGTAATPGTHAYIRKRLRGVAAGMAVAFMPAPVAFMPVASTPVAFMPVAFMPVEFMGAMPGAGATGAASCSTRPDGQVYDGGMATFAQRLAADTSGGVSCAAAASEVAPVSVMLHIKTSRLCSHVATNEL